MNNDNIGQEILMAFGILAAFMVAVPLICHLAQKLWRPCFTFFERHFEQIIFGACLLILVPYLWPGLKEILKELSTWISSRN